MLKNESIFKHHITSLELMDSDLKNTILLAKMTKFIWCAEIYNTTNYGAKEKEAIGLILLYATEANQESINALIFAGYLIGTSVLMKIIFYFAATIFALPLFFQPKITTLTSKRIKISFSTVNKGKYTIISKDVIAEANKKIKAEMKQVIREFEKRQTKSQQQAARLTFNA